MRPRAVLASVAAAAVLLATAMGSSAALAQTTATTVAAASGSGTDYTALVDPFVSTAGDDGNDLPGAQAPHGLAKVNPMTTPDRNHSGYDYDEDQIAGFTSTNLDGVGGSGGGGDLLVVPTSVDYTARPSTSTYAHTYSHDDEEASPGYYRVGLGSVSGTDSSVSATGGTIDAEVTATTRTSLQRYSFPEGDSPSLVLDLANNFTSRTDASVAVTTLADGTVALSGMIAGTFNGAAYRMYYYATTEQAATVQTWGVDDALGDGTSQQGADIGAVLSFADADASDIELRITLSTISADQAAIDQQNEVGGLTFDQARAQTTQTWNDTLGKVDVTSSITSDPDGSLTKLFYTHLYRMYALPVNATSTSGTYMGVDGVVHTADDYTYYDGWSSWDDFRKYSVLAYIDPDGYRDIIQSLITIFADASSTGEDIGSLTQSVPTVRWELSSVIVADALSKGYTGFDRLDEAYQGLKDYIGYYTGDELRQGYVSDDPGQSVLWGYEQWGLAQIADALGRTDDAATLDAYSTLAIENLYLDGAWTASDGTSVALLTPRDGDGNWASVDYEQFQAANLYQGTLWQYNWYDAYDMAGLIEAMGGTDAAAAAIEHMFGEDSDADDGSTMLHSNANEIDLQAPYLFNYVGEASLTQKWVRQIYTGETWNRYIATTSTDEASSSDGEFTPPIYTKVYDLSPEGFLPTMDNDAGTMSTMFVAAAIGLFPVTSGSSQYQIGSPFFESTTITYDDGAQFTVRADGVSADSYYIQSATLNGSDFQNTWLDYSDVVSGGTLEFQMGSEASDWGDDTEAAYSLSTADGGSDDTATAVTVDATSIAAAADGTVDGAVTMTLPAGTVFAGSEGTELISAGGATISGLPDGVSATATVTGTDTVQIRLSGSTTRTARFYVAFADAAITGSVAAAKLTGTGVSNKDALTLSVAAGVGAELQSLIDEAVLVRAGNYDTSSYAAFQSALQRAQTALADTSTTDAKLKAVAESLQAAIDALTLSAGAYSTIQAEDFTAWSGGDLKSEAYYSDGDIGGITEGAWLQYSGLDFGGVVPQSVSVTFANSQATTAEASSVDVYAGGTDGTLVATVSLPGTGSWATYQTASANISDGQSLVDAGEVTLVFHKPSGQSWVANIDSFQFSTAAVTDDESSTVASLTAANATATGGGTKTLNLSSGIFENVTDTAWAQWSQVDFGAGADTLAISYDKPQSRAASDSAVEVRLGSADGDPVVTVPLTYTGSGWGTVGTVTAAVDPLVFGGVQDVYVTFTSTTQTDSQPYVANVYSIDFVASAATTVTLEAEDFVASSGGGLKTETTTWDDGTTVVNLGGTSDGSWLDYGDIDFGGGGMNTVAVHYVNNSSRCGTGSAIEVYLDSFDSSNPGTPYTTLSLPVTGSSWTTAGTISATLPSTLTGTHTVYLRLTTNADSSHPYVANIDDLVFSYAEPDTSAVDLSALQTAVDAYAALADDAGRYGSIDFGVFTTQLATARALLTASSVTQNQVVEQTRALTLAATQLIPRIRALLENLVDATATLTDQRYTDETWTALQSALTAAQQVVADDAATDDALQSAYDVLTAARTALATRDLTVPATPAYVSATVSGTAIEVAWSLPEDDGGSAVTGYLVELDDGHSVRIDDPSQQQATFTWLESGTAYRARVSAINAVGTSAATAYTAAATAGATIPDAPVVVSVTTTGTETTVTWQAPASDGGSAIIAYVVTLSDGSTTTVSADATSALLTGTAGGDLTATVAAVTAAGSSADVETTADEDSAATTGDTTASTSVAQGDGSGATVRLAASIVSTAYVPSAFSDAELDADYDSDSWDESDGSSYFVDLLSGFSDLGTDILAPNEEVADGSTITAENDRIAVEINNSASQEQVDKAEVDADNSPTETLSDGLGSQLGDLYLAALESGELPKTSALFDRVSENLNETDTAKDTFGYLRPYVRLNFVGDGGLIYESDNGSYDSLTTSGSFPSGHTYSGYQAGTILATLLPELSSTILARASEYGDNRIVLGFHYPLDVIGSRMTSQATVAHRWADDDFASLLEQAHEEIETVLLEECEAAGYGDTLTECAGDPYDGLTDEEAVDVYTERLSYGFSQIGEAGQQLEVPDEAAALLTTAFPDLSDEQRAQILEQTALDSGYPLDQTGDGEASWQRINLAAAMDAEIEVADDGTVTVTNVVDATAQSVSTASSIEVAGLSIDGFDADTRTYVVDWPADADLPTVSATASEPAAAVAVAAGSEIVGSGSTVSASDVLSTFAEVDGVALPAWTITVTSAGGAHTTTYTVALARTGDDHLPAGVSAGDGSGGADPGSGGTGGEGENGGDATASDDGSGTTATGVLAATGAELLPLLIIAGSLLAAGLAAAGTSRARRRRATR
ncbi:MAG: glycoside hydrolase family 92 protein [Microbacterium sp.]|uniref:glycoside hydrolase domain-containing protein n=1 Tax=Microbacterium sp. TaxID=51671 RepID=UPI0039E22B26